MKRYTAVIIIIGLLFSAFAEVSRPSLDGRAKVADVGELPVGLFAKSASFLPGDTVIVTNPATKISIEVMIFGNIGSSEGIAIVLSPEAARELYINKGSNVIVQVTKKSDTYTESSVLAKTLQTYTPEAEPEPAEDSQVEPEFDTPSEETDEDFYFYDDPDAVIEMEASEVAFEEPEWPAEVVETEPQPAEPVEEEVAFEEPEWPAEVVETEPEPAEPVEEEVAFEEPEWPAEVVETEPLPAEPVEEVVAFEEPEWSEEPECSEEPYENENFIEETETVLIPADPNPPSYESIIQEEPEIVIIPIFEEESSEPEEEPIEVVPVIIEEEPEVTWVDIPAVEEEPVIEAEPVIKAEPVTDSIPFGEMISGKWYIQIATCSKVSAVEDILAKYGKKYPIVVVKLESGDMRVLVGSLSEDEYPTILARFKSFGYTDAFARSR